MANPADETGGGTGGGPVEDHVALPGGKVHVLRNGNGAPLLFLHAAGGAGQWLEFHELLARDFDVIAPDHPGFGGSDEFPEVEAMDDLVFHYLGLIERLGLERPHIVGGSFGGWVAAELAVAAPQAVGSLVLLSPAGLRIPDHPVADLFRMTPPELMDTLYHDLAKAPPMPDEPDVDMVLAAYRDMTALARFSWVPFLANPKLERRLHRISAHTLVVWPDDDRLVPIAHGHRYAELIPDAKFEVIGGCGHAMYFERPEEFARTVSTFLANGSSVSSSLEGAVQ